MTQSNKSLKKIVFLTGAGVSVDSGVSTFRDNNGLWKNHDVMEVASIQGWRSKPEVVLDFYNERRAQLGHIEANAAHFAIAGLENDYNITVLTQNVDNLHEKAGSSKVIHLHGELTKIRPEDSCTEKDKYDESKVLEIGYSPINIGDVDKRGVQYRPHIVFFGEPVSKIGKAISELTEADYMVIVGTSLAVQPVASLWQFTPVGCPVIVIDPNKTPIDGEEEVINIREKATAGVAKAIEMIKYMEND